MPDPTLESKNQAASMKVGTSNYVASAALAVIGGAAALFTYISQTFDPPLGFDLVMLFALLCLVGSIVVGGLGADDVTSAVADATWTKSSAGAKFEWQAGLTLLGLVLVLIGTWVGATSARRESGLEERVQRLERQVKTLGASDRTDRAR
jgi:hypothetical protein